MSSDESDEFEGFSQGEIDEAEARYRQVLDQQGIGDDSDLNLSSDPGILMMGTYHNQVLQGMLRSMMVGMKTLFTMNVDYHTSSI